MIRKNVNVCDEEDTKDFKINENILSLDTIEIDKDKIIKSSTKTKHFTNNEAFPILSIGLIVTYGIIYVLCVYGKHNLIDVDFGFLKSLGVATGDEILNGNFYALILNIFVHRSIWDLANTIFILVFCGFFIERYIKRTVILGMCLICAVIFNIISLFVFPHEYYLGSFTIMACLIGMCLYFSYRFRRFVMTIDLYIYISLTIIGFFLSYMISFYSVFQFTMCFLSGIFAIFVLDTKCLRENRER